MKAKIAILSILLFSPHFYRNQAKNTTMCKQLVYNVSIGAVVGAVGAIINKQQEQQWAKVLAKGFYQGALGGYITFESKRLVNLAEKNSDWTILWCAKIVNAAGTSVKENAALNEDFWKRWHINIGFSRIEFETQNQFKVNYKIMPIALVYTIGIATQAKFELNKTLMSGEFVFSSNTRRFSETNSLAATFPGSVVISTPELNNFSILSHEIIHLYQANDFSTFEAFYNKPLNSMNRKSQFLDKTNKFIHFDFRYLPQLLLYKQQSDRSHYYYDNILEREAGFYSNTFDGFILK